MNNVINRLLLATIDGDSAESLSSLNMYINFRNRQAHDNALQAINDNNVNPRDVNGLIRLLRD